MVRSELESTAHRLANHIECQLAAIVPALLVESRVEDLQGLIYNICEVIKSLRKIGAVEGGDV